jgi:hypothetical protein
MVSGEPQVFLDLPLLALTLQVQTLKEPGLPFSLCSQVCGTEAGVGGEEGRLPSPPLQTPGVPSPIVQLGLAAPCGVITLSSLTSCAHLHV